MAPTLAQQLLAVAALLPIILGQTSTVDYCVALDDVISICELETPSFTGLPVTQQASCLCGSTLATLPWGVSSWEFLASNCVSQYATINPTIASDASVLEGMCSSNNFQPQSAGATATASAAASTPPTTAGPAIPPPSSLPTSPAASISTGIYNSSPPSSISVVTVPQATTTVTQHGGAARLLAHNANILGFDFMMGLWGVIGYMAA